MLLSTIICIDRLTVLRLCLMLEATTTLRSGGISFPSLNVIKKDLNIVGNIFLPVNFTKISLICWLQVVVVNRSPFLFCKGDVVLRGACTCTFGVSFVCMRFRLTTNK